jgi:phage tail sheath protein FI
VIRKFGRTQPVRSWGTRTLDASPKGRFKYIPVRRFFQYAEKSVVDSTRWGVFRNNNFKLWGKLTDAVDTWLTNLMPDGAFPTPVKELAFFVKMGIEDGTMDAQDVDDGIVIGEIGLAPNKPGEFIVWRFSQFDSGWDVLEQV